MSADTRSKTLKLKFSKRQLSLPVSMMSQVVGQTIEQRGRHLGVPEHAGPFAEGEVCVVTMIEVQCAASQERATVPIAGELDDIRERDQLASISNGSFAAAPPSAEVLFHDGLPD